MHGSMDVFISEDYVKRRHEMKRKEKKLAEVQVYQRMDSINSSSSTPRSPGENSKSFSPSPSPVVKIKSQGERASIVPSFDSIYHCFTP